MAKQSKEINAAAVALSIKKEAAPLFRKIKKVQIVDNKSYSEVATNVKALKAIAKVAVDKRDSLVEPLEKVIDEIKELFAPFITSVQDTERAAKLDMKLYNDKLALAKHKVVKQLQTGKIAKLSTAAKKLEQLELKSENSSIRKVWTLIEIDARVTPHEYMVPDQAKIKEAFKAGKKVLGWKWEQVETIAI